MGSKKKAIWLSYDFGLKSNYSELFTFLDNYKAKDCGNGLAYFIYDNEGMLSSDALIDKLKAEINDVVKPSVSDRIYVIWKDDEKSVLSVKGRFIFGARKAPIWNGYSNRGENKQEDEAI